MTTNIQTNPEEQTTLPMEANPKQVRDLPKRRGAKVYDNLLWRIQPLLEDQHGVATTIGITSCDKKDGATTLIANLATRAADHGLGPILLVDSCASRPGLTGKYRFKNMKGLADLLSGSIDQDQAISSSKVEGLDILPIGSRGLIDRIGIEPHRMYAAMDGLRESYNAIFFDLPPASELLQSLLIARRLDHVLLAVRSGVANRNLVERTVHQLRTDGVNLAGTILTRHRSYVPHWISKRF